jgi:hypothetical protein
MAITTSDVLVHGQVGVEDLKLAQSLDLVVGIEFSGLCRFQSLGFEHGLFSPNSDGVWIILNDALQVKSVAWQYALRIRRWNLEASWKLKVNYWRWRDTLC